MNDRSRLLRFGLAALIFALLGTFVGLRLEVTTDITHFLAAGDEVRLAKFSRRLAQAELTRTVILVVDAGGDAERAGEASDALVAALEDNPEVAWIQNGVDANAEQAFFALYQPHRLQMCEADAERRAERTSDAGLRAEAKELVRQLGLPTAPAIKKLVPGDPLLCFPAQLDRVRAASGGTLALIDGRFVTAEGAAVVFLTSVHSPFSAAHQRPLQAAIRRAWSDIGAAELELAQSGFGRFALDAEDDIRADVQRISIISTVGVVLLFLVVFRSPRLMVLSFIPLASGVLLATALTLLVFGRVHGLTLAFGASLVGVCIDYPVHLFNHHGLHAGEGGAVASLRRIRAGLLLGAATTIAGFSGLGWTSFPGVREIAVFASVGIAGALAATLWLLPSLMPDQPKPVAVQRGLADLAGRVLDMAHARRGLLWLLPVVGVGVAVAGVPQLRFVDDVAALTQRDEQLLAEDDRVRAAVSRMESAQVVIAWGADEQAALTRNDAAYARLSEAVRAGAVDEFRSLHSFLWSAETQAASRSMFEGENFRARFEAAFAEQGLRPAAFGEFWTHLAEASSEPLVFEDLRGSVLDNAAGRFRVEGEGDEKVGVLTFVRGVKDPDGLRARLADLEGVEYFDQREMMGDLYRRHREQTLRLIGVGLIGVFVMVFARYRKLRLSLAAFLPAVLAAGATLGVLGALGEPINLLHVVALLLVLSMGVDYGVFLAESRGGDEVRATCSSLFLACISTVLAFGLLALSDNPAMRAIGLTTGIGVAWALLLSPTTLVVLGAAPRGQSQT